MKIVKSLQKKLLVFALCLIGSIIVTCLCTVYYSEAAPSSTITNSNKVEGGGAGQTLSMEYHCFSDGSQYGSETSNADFEYQKAVRFSAISGSSRTYEGWEIFPSEVDLKIYPLPVNNKVGGHKLSDDWAKKIDLSYLSMGYEKKDVKSINNAGDSVGYGLVIVKIEYDNGETTLNAIDTDFFKSSVDGDPKPCCPKFSANGKYTISLFFEATGSGGNNHRIDVKFRIINTRSSEGNKNSVVIDNLGSAGGNVHKNGATNSSFKVNFNDLKHLSVSYSYASVNGNTLSGSVYNGRTFSDPGLYTIYQKIGPFDLETFTVTLDTRTPTANFDNIKKQTSDLMTAEGYVSIFWDAGNSQQWKIACEIYNRDTYTDDDPGALLGRSLSGNTVVDAPGQYKVVLRFDNSSDLLIPGFRYATYNVDVEEYANPCVNYEALSASRFNYIKTKWYELDHGGDIRCFFDYDSAFKYAMSIEDEVVLNESSFKAQYYDLYSNISKIYVKYSGTHSSKITAIRSNPVDNIALTDVMNTRASQRIREKYFEYDDTAERLFEEDSMFDNSHMYLDDDFQFVKKGEWESSTVKYRNCDTGQEGIIPYGVPMSHAGLPNGKYEITESDKYGNQTKYAVYRDKSAPVVNISLNGDSVCQAMDKTYTVDYFSIASFVDEYDPWAVLKVNDNYYVGREIPDIIYGSGIYRISCYDRNKNLTGFTVTVKDRRIDPIISADNGNREYAVNNGGNYTVYNYSLSLFGASFPDVFYDISVNGKTVSYNDICKTETGHGVYSVKITDKYSDASIGFGIRIAEREISPILIWDDYELTRITQNARYTVNRFRIEYDDNYIRIDGVPSCEQYIVEGGTYDLTAIDIYNGNELNFTVVVEERDISVATKIDYDNDVILTGGEYIVVNQFKLNKLTKDRLYYMTVKINGVEYDNGGKIISTPGIYRIDVENLFNGKKYASVFVIEERPLELAYRVNNDDRCINGDAQGVLYNFIIDDLPEYLNLYVNGKSVKASDLPRLYSEAGLYDIIIIDKYSAEQTVFTLELAERYMPEIVCDGDTARPISEREYTVRRFKFVDIPSYIKIIVNGSECAVNDFITAAGIYNIEIRDVYAATSKNITVTVDGERPDVALVYDDNLKTIISDGCEYDLYRFRINPLTAEKSAYTQITVNGIPYEFGGFITAFGDYEIAVKDIYKDTEERAVVHISARELSVELSCENGMIDHTDGATYTVKLFNIKNTSDHLLVTVNGNIVADNAVHHFYEFGEYKIKAVDKYNGASVEFSVIISNRAEMPDIEINNSVRLTAENGGTYSVYKFALTALEHQVVTVNGVAVKNCEYTKAGNYKVLVKDIYSGKENSFGITVKNMIDLPDVYVDFGEKTDIANGDKLSAYRFKIEYADLYQYEYLNIYLNGESYAASSKYMTASGVYNVRIENICTGDSTAIQITVKDRPLYLPIIADNDAEINATGDINVLRFKIGNGASLQGYASVHGALYADYNNNVGVYEYTITDIYTNDTLTVRVAVVDICEYIGFAYNKCVVSGSADIAIDSDKMDMIVRVDGREINWDGKGFRLIGDSNGTHYYLHVTNKFNDNDVCEIYVIVRGISK